MFHIRIFQATKIIWAGMQIGWRKWAVNPSRKIHWGFKSLPSHHKKTNFKWLNKKDRKRIANVTLKTGIFALIDLKEINDCKIKIKGSEYFVTCLYTKESKRYAMIQGGYLVEIDEDTFNNLNIILEEHYKNHIYKKK